MDVFATGDHHVVCSADDRQAAFFIEAADIPGEDEPPRAFAVGAVGVSVKCGAASDEDPTIDTVCDPASTKVEDLDVNACQRFASCPWVCAKIIRSSTRRECRFGASVEVIEDVTEGIHEFGG